MQHGRQFRVIYYRLDENKQVVPIEIDPRDPTAHLEKFEQMLGDIDQRRVGEDPVGKFRVSTVFLGLDHDYGWRQNVPHYQPLVFETMVFHKLAVPKKSLIGDREFDEDGIEQWRYRTYEAAKKGHDAVVAQVRAHGTFKLDELELLEQ